MLRTHIILEKANNYWVLLALVGFGPVWTVQVMPTNVSRRPQHRRPQRCGNINVTGCGFVKSDECIIFTFIDAQ